MPADGALFQPQTHPQRPNTTAFGPSGNPYGQIDAGQDVQNVEQQEQVFVIKKFFPQYQFDKGLENERHEEYLIDIVAETDEQRGANACQLPANGNHQQYSGYRSQQRHIEHRANGEQGGRQQQGRQPFETIVQVIAEKEDAEKEIDQVFMQAEQIEIIVVHVDVHEVERNAEKQKYPPHSPTLPTQPTKQRIEQHKPKQHAQKPQMRGRMSGKKAKRHEKVVYGKGYFCLDKRVEG